MAKQVNVMDDKFSDYERDKSETHQLLKNILDSQNAIKQELFLLRNMITKDNCQSNNVKNSAQHPTPHVPTFVPPLPPQPAPFLSSSTPAQRPCVSPSPKPPSARKPPPRQSQQTFMASSWSSHPKQKQEVSHKTLFIGDSISGNVDIKALENATNTKFSTAKAYSTLNDTKSNKT